jgi:hypothetical protein
VRDDAKVGNARVTLILSVVITLASVAFWLGIAGGLVELAGILAFWPWAFRLGRRISVETHQAIRHSQEPGQHGVTRFAAFKVLADGTCLFRRKTGFLQTALEWKGVIRWRGELAEVTAVQPLGPLVSGAAMAVGWFAYGILLLLQGVYVVGAGIIAIVVAATLTSLKSIDQTGKVRYGRYLEEVKGALAEAPR